MPVTEPSFSPAENVNPEIAPSVLDELPASVRDELNRVGVNGNAMLGVKADIAPSGVWGERYLVATSDRLLVLSVKPPENGAAKAFANSKAGEAVIDLDVPLESISEAEAKGMVGNSALEVRIKPLDDGRATNGAATNGHSSIVDSQAKVVELLRASNAHAGDLRRAARQLEQLRDTGTLKASEGEDERDKKKCPTCGRALGRDSNICPNCTNKWRALQRLFGYMLPYKWMAIGNGLLSLSDIALRLIPIILVQPLVDRVFLASANKNAQQGGAIAVLSGWVSRASSNISSQALLGWLVAAIVTSSLIGAGVNIVRGRTNAFLGARVLHDIRSQLYEHLQRLSVAYYDKREVGAVMSRVQNDVGQVQNFLLDSAENIILSSLTIVGVVCVMFSSSWQLALAVLVPVPIVVLGTNRYWLGLRKLWRRVQHNNSSLGARLADSLGGVRVVRAFAQEHREVETFLRKSGELRDSTMNVERKAAGFYPVIGFIMGLGLPITWFVGGQQVLNNQLSFGALSVFILLLGRLYEPVQQLTRLVNSMSRAMTAAERVFEVLDTEPDIVEVPDAVPMPRIEGNVEFKEVVFGYDKHRPALKGVNLEVHAGEMIGLVGHSGAGKSTLINLLMRFYDVDDGQILIDGVDIRKIRRNDMRRQIGVVLQEPYLFHGSVFNNIRYAKPDATVGEVMQAAKAAYAHDFIVGFPDGYDTLVGERGTRLSGGERQRISIARAILHDPRILILDEATASVDTETEAQIQKALQNLVKGRTTFAIAHRLSTLRNADRLVVLEDGKIAEVGTHDELLSKRGVFHRLVSMQQAINEIHMVGG